MRRMLTRALTTSVLAAIAATGVVIAEDDIEKKVIEIRAIKDKDVTVMVDEDNDAKTIVLTQEEIDDPELLRQRLGMLNDETIETVIQAVSGTKHLKFGSLNVDNGDGKKVFVINKGDGESLHTMVKQGSGFDMEFSFDDNHIVIGNGNTVLKGHTDAIVKMIERGEFDYDELDKIQAALDAKR